MEDITSASMTVLATYREMIEDSQKCEILCKDTECLMFLVYMLKDQEDEIIVESLQILLRICETPHCSAVSMIFGLVPSLNLLISSNQNCDIQSLARKLQRIISSHTKNQPSCEAVQNVETLSDISLKTPTRPHFLGMANSKAKTVKLKILGLESKAQRLLCEGELITVKGVISITFDLKKSYCFVRARSDLKTKLLGEAIRRTKTMTAQEVVRNELGEEILVPLGSNETGGLNTSKSGDHLPYLPEKDSPIKENAIVHHKRDLKRTTVHFLASVTNFLSRSLYW